MKTESRSYRQQRRAEAAERTGAAILGAAAALWREKPIEAITLEAIAERAGVAVRTVIRRFGSKSGVFDAAIEAEGARIRTERRTPVGDVRRAVEAVVGHYERDGAAVLRTLAVEGTQEAARAITEVGRKEHRRWCAEVFGPYLPKPESARYSMLLDGFVAATDLYLWKLLRHDLGRSAEETKRVVTSLVEGLAQGTSSGG